MSAPAQLFVAPRPSRRSRIEGRVVVLMARLIANLSPLHIARLLTLVSRGAPAATFDRALSARRTVVSISVICAGEGCLPRSIAIALLCRMHGSWPRWCTGVCVEPFRAHAWVEAEGMVVGEALSSEHFQTMLAVPR